jgi:hypothetical protein
MAKRGTKLGLQGPAQAQVGCKRMWLVLEKGNDDEVVRFEVGRERTAGQVQGGGERRGRMRSRSR